ncbi:MAG: DUF192 domain-containing protein [Bacteroidales bacterium]
MKQKNKRKIPKTNKRKKTIIISVLVVILIIVSSIFLFNYETNNEVLKSIENRKLYEPPFTKSGQLFFINKDKTTVLKTIEIEIADTDDKRAQGLMWRREMADSVGMLFIFEKEMPLSFWMKNTYIPLDIIYINKSMEIVAIQENTMPLSEMPIPSEKPAQFVVEVNAGFCSNYGIINGDKIKYEKINAR